jgi:hypothetical protein
MPGQNINARPKTMRTPAKEWEIACDRTTFKRVRKDEKFPYIVALARSVNALNTVHSLLLRSPKVETPERVRNGMNSYFFASALLYEGLRLIRKMNKAFAEDNAFQNGLRMLLKNPVAVKIEQSHLNPARNHAVFHFLPDEFKKAIGKAAEDRNIFVVALGKKRRSLHYAYADVLAAEILVGVPSDNPEFWSTFANAAKETSDLVIRFSVDAEGLIGNYLKAMGFKRE